MHYQGFERLIKKMDEIAGKIDEKVIMQIGHSKYLPKNAEYFDFANDQKIKELNRVARVVICHGGVGSIILALEQGTPIIAVPRLKKYREATHDKQLEIVNALAERGKLTAVYEVDELEKALRNIPAVSVKVERDRRLVNALKEYINKLDISIKNRGQRN